jgi:anti-sigma regulatory factor (Ser/Thr protein kinase)
VSVSVHEHTAGFCHRALFYSDLGEYVRETSGFLREGLVAGEPALVVVSGEKIALLREELGSDAEHVRFADMNDVGLNPARIIPAWRQFVDANVGPGHPARGIGEPIWPGRSADELTECDRHEALLNLAFADSPAWRLLCPYDAENLPDDVLDGARRNHADVDLDEIAQPFSAPLPPAPSSAHVFTLEAGNLDALRTFVVGHAEHERLGAKTAALALAVNELGANSLRHGGGSAQLRLWSSDDGVVCEVRDAGFIEDPLVGRVRPHDEAEGGRGVWLANQLCDLVQVRSSPAGTTVRVHVTRPAPVLICRMPWGELHLDERQCKRLTNALWKLGMTAPGATLAATKLTQTWRRGACHVELDARESKALESALVSA